jgi:membrane-associated phospholipid phosphatase
MTELDHGRRNRHQLVTFADDFLLAVLPFRHPGSAEAYNFWRPVAAIRNGDSDGNPATEGDANWSSFIPTPPFPDYISGHSTFSGAAAGVLALFFRTPSLRFATESDSLPGVVRRFRSVWAAAREAAISRLYGGIHYRSANDDGLRAGLNIGVWVFMNTLEPKKQRHDR